MSITTTFLHNSLYIHITLAEGTLSFYTRVRKIFCFNLPNPFLNLLSSLKHLFSVLQEYLDLGGSKKRSSKNSSDPRSMLQSKQCQAIEAEYSKNQHSIFTQLTEEENNTTLPSNTTLSSNTQFVENI